MTVLGVAALSARVLAEAASDDGFEVVALDLFGDADTRRACAQWSLLGTPGSMRIDADRLEAALRALARRGDVAGWIAGSGFEGRSDLLERGAALVPLLGTQAAAVRQVRDARAFFAFLDGKGIAHPEVRATAPGDAAGWLVKDAHGCGGGHIRRAAAPAGAHSGEPVPAHGYFQREVVGTPMSATFIADGRDACVLGFNEQIVRGVGVRPFVYCGVVGPVPLALEVAAQVTTTVRALAHRFALRGLGSLDFVLDGATAHILELNPRPPASLALYGKRVLAEATPGALRGIVAAHVHACLRGELPHVTTHGAGRAVAGTEIVYALHPLDLDAAAVHRLAQRAGCHDLPAAAARFETGEPVCSVSASGASAAQVHALLQRARAAVCESLETCR
jgi:uncharacterized protein